MFPSGENATETIGSLARLRVSPRSVRSSCPVATSQSLIVPSTLPEARILPSGENATVTTESECPVRMRSTRPLITSQSITLRSELPEASVRPSGVNLTEKTSPECPLKVCNLRHSTSQNLTVLSLPPEATKRPSGENAMELTKSEFPNCGKISGLSCAWTKPRHAHTMVTMANIRVIIDFPFRHAVVAHARKSRRALLGRPYPTHPRGRGDSRFSFKVPECRR